MNKKLQQFVATKFEESGFIAYAKDIRFARDSKGIQKVATTIIQRLMQRDPEGFGKTMHTICVKGEANHDS